MLAPRLVVQAAVRAIDPARRHVEMEAAAGAAEVVLVAVDHQALSDALLLATGRAWEAVGLAVDLAVLHGPLVTAAQADERARMHLHGAGLARRRFPDRIAEFDDGAHGD